MRSIEAGEGDALDNSLPVGERRSRVWSCGVVDWERNAVRRFVSSIVCDIVGE